MTQIHAIGAVVGTVTRTQWQTVCFQTACEQGTLHREPTMLQDLSTVRKANRNKPRRLLFL